MPYRSTLKGKLQKAQRNTLKERAATGTVTRPVPTMAQLHEAIRRASDAANGR